MKIKTKRFISSILVFLMVILSCGVVFATAESSNTKITASSVEVTKASTVDVDIRIENNPGILGAVLSISYDSGLTLIGATSGAAFSALTMTRPGNYSSPCNFTWDGIEIDNDDIKDGTILTLTFEVEDTANEGDIYNIFVSGDSDNIIDAELNPVNVSFNSGKITIKPETTNNKTTFTVNSIQGEAGSSVDVNVSITNNPGILGAILSVSYDERLTLLNATQGTAFSALSLTKPGAYTSPCNFAWDGVDLDNGDIKDGVVLTLSFKIPDNATAEDVYSITVSSDDGDIVDSELNTVLPDFISGKITVNSSAVPDSLTFTVDSVAGKPGDTVDVNVSIINNPGILGAVLTLNYDEGLILKNATAGTAFSTLSMTKPGRYSSPCNFTWDGIEISSSDIRDGIVLTLSFEIPSTAVSGDVFNISVSSGDDNIIDSNLEPVTADFVSGGITISHSHEHTYIRSVVEPTCEGKGYVQYTCSICHNIYKTDYTDEIGHYYHYTGNGLDTVLTYECNDCGNAISINAAEVYSMWNSYYINLKPNSTDNRTKTDNSSLINVVEDSSANDGIINGKDYGFLLHLAEKENAQ